MQQSSSLSSKSYNTSLGVLSDQDKKNPPGVNWISVISFLQNQYTKSSIREKEWFLEKKLLNQEILKLKSQLTAVERLNYNLNNRIKLLENALKKEKLMKQPNQKDKQQKPMLTARTIQEVQKYFQKNGWNLSQKPKSLENNPHKLFLTKVLDEVGVNFGKIEEKCRKMSFASVDTEKNERKNTGQKFESLVNQLNKVKISFKTKINAHLDAVRGIYATNTTSSSTLLVSVSQDCLVKSWNIDSKNKQKLQSVEPVACFRQHTGQLFTIDGGTYNEGTNDLALFTGGTEEYVKVWYAGSRDKAQDLKCVGWFSNEKQANNEQSNELENEIVWNLKYKNKRLLTSASDGIVRLFNVLMKNEERTITPQINLLNEFSEKGYIQTVLEWVGDGGFLTGCANSPRLHLWDIERLKIVQKYIYEIDKQKDDKNNLKKQSNFSIQFQTNALKYQPDLKMIYTGCQDKSIRIFSYDENKMIKKLDTGINDSINCIDFYKSNFIVAGCQNGSLKIWDRRTYRLLIDEQGHRAKYDQGILCLKTTEDGIFTGGADGIVNFYTI